MVYRSVKTHLFTKLINKIQTRKPVNKGLCNHSSRKPYKVQELEIERTRTYLKVLSGSTSYLPYQEALLIYNVKFN